MKAYEIRPKRTVLDMVIRAFAVFGFVAVFNFGLEAADVEPVKPKVTQVVPCTYTLRDSGGNQHEYNAKCTVEL